MEEKLISFKTAKLLKESGHYFRSEHFYNTDGILRTRVEWLAFDNISQKDIIYAPTQSLVQKWLREKHNCFIEIYLHGEEHKDWEISLTNLMFGVEVNYYGKNFDIPTTENADYNNYEFKSYENALEAGLQESIKIINKK